MSIHQTITFEIELEDSEDMLEVEFTGILEEGYHAMDGFKEASIYVEEVTWNESKYSTADNILISSFINDPANMKLIEEEILKAYEKQGQEINEDRGRLHPVFEDIFTRLGYIFSSK